MDTSFSPCESGMIQSQWCCVFKAAVLISLSFISIIFSISTLRFEIPQLSNFPKPKAFFSVQGQPFTANKTHIKTSSATENKTAINKATVKATTKSEAKTAKATTVKTTTVKTTVKTKPADKTTAKPTTQTKPATVPKPETVSQVTGNTASKELTIKPPIHAATGTGSTTGGSIKPPVRSASDGSMDDGVKLICHNVNGRLGNQLFQVASIMGLALAMNRIPVFRNAGLLDRALNTSTRHPDKQENYEKRCGKSRIVGERNCCTFTKTLTKLDPTVDYTVGGYLQSWKYWIVNEDKVLERLQFSDRVRDRASAVVQQLRQQFNGSVLIAVHVRKGDIAPESARATGYVSASPEYIKRAVEYYTRMFPNASFAVASDTLQWCREHFPSGYRVQYIDTREPAVDLLVLASLDHIVLTTGTFSWWAGYLNKGMIVYLKDFIIPGTLVGKQFNPGGKDFVFPGWLPL